MAKKKGLTKLCDRVCIDGQLEIDTRRGVLYFHAAEGKLRGASVLRICGLPKPLPRKVIDLTLRGGMAGAPRGWTLFCGDVY